VPPPARYANNGEQIYDKQKYKKMHEAAKAGTGKPIYLNKRQMEAACEVIAETASRFACDGIIAVGRNHVHIMAKLSPGMTTGFFCNRVKSKSSLRLSDYGLKGKVWARRYQAKRIGDEGLKTTFNYVKKHRGEGAVIKEF